MLHRHPFNLLRLIGLLPSLIGLLLILVVPSLSHAAAPPNGPGIVWTSRTSAANNNWRSVTYGNGLFVAVAYSGSGNRVMTSPDGSTWTSRTSAADNNWYGVTYGNGLFVAVATSGTGNRVMTSPDGSTWTSRTSAADNYWYGVTYGNGLFVAVAGSGTGNRVMTSPDGSTWTSRASAVDNSWYSVTYGNGLFVAVAATGTGNRVMTSPDGITWTSRTSAADNNWYGVTYGNGLFVAVAYSGGVNQVMTSPDGITWTSRTSPINGWNTVVYGNGLFVAVSNSGTGNRVMTSPDGSTWTSRTSAVDNQWFSVTYGNGLFVAVATSGTGNRVMTSPAVYAPTLSAISPAYGITAGGTTTTITGTGFVSGGISGVTFGGTAATNVTYVSATSFTATTPAHAAGTASVLVTTPGGTNSANSLFKYTNCGPGVPITTGTAGVGALWQMLALPCVPTTSTIAGTFGTGTSSNLNTATYASTTPTTSPYGWIIEDRTVGAIPAYVPLLTSDISLSTGIGYWLKSYQAPTNGTLTMEGTATPTDVTQAQGCYSANGCKAITVTAYTTVGSNRYNLVGNPFPYNVEWSKVRIRVDGSASTLTPTQANTANIVSNTVNIWNDTGTGYNSFTDVTPSPATPNLQYFKSFWVNVLPGAVGHTVELLIPAEQSTLSYLQAAPDQLAQTATLESMPTVEMPWYLGWLDLVVSPAAAAPLPAVSDHVNPQKLPYLKDWYIRLKLDNPVTGWKDHGMLLGQLSDANLGFDRHDIAKMAPFTAPYLSLVFIHPDWGLKAADYASNFHPYSSTVDVWHFQIHADPVGSIVYLSWEGSPALLTRSRLIEVSTGKVILANDPRWKSKGYPITLTSTVQDYIWRVLP